MRCEICGKSKIKTHEHILLSERILNLCSDCSDISTRLHTYKHNVKEAKQFGGLQKAFEKDETFALMFRVLSLKEVQ